MPELTSLDTVEAGPSRWEVATRETQNDLRSIVTRLTGYDERTEGPAARDELPGARIVVIVELGPALRVAGLERAAGRGIEGGFVAGLSMGPTRAAHDGWQRGVQLDLRPTAAARLLGLPLKELTDHVVPLDGLSPVRALSGRARQAAQWDGRLALVEQWIRERMAATAPIDPRIRWAESRLLDDGGQLEISALWHELGMSERHFIARFTEAVGVTPKRYARLSRFERICEGLGDRNGRPLAQLALDVGCYDQAHLSRETRALAGLTPTELREALGGVAAWPHEL